MKPILVLNPGSTSFKFKLYGGTGDADERILAQGAFERVSAAAGPYSFRTPDARFAGEGFFPGCLEAFEESLRWLTDNAVLSSMEDIGAVAFKAVHAGALSGTRRVDGALLEAMDRFTALAPAHNPVYTGLMRRLRERYPALVQIARFETAFHQTIPEHRQVYGVPLAWARELGIRRYGFHGSSHEYIAWRMAELAPRARRILSLHLGGSSSLCAILDGQSVANSMGATPQSGVFHNNRVGDFDVYCLPYLMARTGKTLEELLAALAGQSGFLGLSGVSGDLRDVEDAAQRGDPAAALALEAFADNAAGYAGQYAAYLGGLDALVFTGGIGLNSASMRRRICDKLASVGVRLGDDGAQGDRRVSASGSGVEVWVVQTDEERIVARHARRFLEAAGA